MKGRGFGEKLTLGVRREGEPTMKRWECAVLVPVERDRREARGLGLSAFSVLVLQSDCVLGG
jgi:hypothetical protein